MLSNSIGLTDKSNYKPRKFRACMVVTITLLWIIATENLMAQLEPDAATPKPTIEEAIVFGRGAQQIGEASTASEGTISGADLAIRPIIADRRAFGGCAGNGCGTTFRFRQGQSVFFARI